MADVENGTAAAAPKPKASETTREYVVLTPIPGELETGGENAWAIVGRPTAATDADARKQVGQTLLEAQKAHGQCQDHRELGLSDVPEQAGQAFLRELWGDGDAPGFLQTWTLHDKRSEYWPHWRGVQTDGQRDTFTAMGTTPRRHGAKHRAKAEQVCATPGLWLDLDVKEGAFPNQHQALSMARRHLLPTLLVASGYGIHAYYLFTDGPWIFRSVAERDEAASLSFRWFTLHQQSAARHGWHVDQLGDLARLMRLPGTWNCKRRDDAKLVRVLRERGPRYTRADFRELLSDVPEQPPGPTSLFDGTVALTGDTSAYAAKLDALIANSPEFAAVWERERTFPSHSEADLSLCSLAAGAMTDPELAQLIAQHRGTDPKGRRADYVARTIRRARSAPARLPHAA
jgi:hypothetical protein